MAPSKQHSKVSKTAVKDFLKAYPKASIRLTRHARERMEEREITLVHILRVLKRGTMVHTEMDIRSGLDKHRIRGTDQDNRPIELVVNLIEEAHGTVVVITVIE